MQTGTRVFSSPRGSLKKLENGRNVELNCIKENFSKIHNAYNNMDQKMADILKDNRSYKNKVSRMYSKREDLIRESNEL
jgi:hypothetical protein